MTYKLYFLFFIPLLSWGQIDPKATSETKNLYSGLKRLQTQGVLLGHQDALAYGLNPDATQWKGETNRSDIKTVTNQHPAVAGWDLGKIEFDSSRNLDKVPFALMKQRIIEHYQRGGISTVSWHLNNPIDPTKTSWDKADSTIKRVLYDRKSLKAYKKWLNKTAAFFKDLKTPDGTLVPIIFRPYHEHTGSWFWWGAGHCTPDDYKTFWQMTVKHLSKKKKVHNLLYAYSTDNFSSKAHYLERYPGHDYVDLLGFDTYHRNAPKSDSAFVANAKRMVGTIRELGQENHKLWAITETGLEQVTEPNWWTNIMLPIVQDSGLSYILLWRNGYNKHYYAPYPTHKSLEDFNKMIQSGNVFLENKVRDSQLYQSRN